MEPFTSEGSNVKIDNVVHVVRVVNGDTLDCYSLLSSGKFCVRLAIVNAPELGAVEGKAVKAS